MDHTSWILLNEIGECHRKLFGPPACVPEGMRVSVQDGIYTTFNGFTMDLGSASSVAFRPSTREGEYSWLEITTIGPNLKEVLKLRARVLERLGIKPVSTFIALPSGLKDSWQRLKWLFRWIWKGPVEQS